MTDTWEVQGKAGDEYLVIVKTIIDNSGKKCDVATVCEIEEPSAVDEKRAQLIASAPELLEAAKRLLVVCEAVDYDGNLDERITGEIMDAVRFAIQEAEGVQS